MVLTGSAPTPKTVGSPPRRSFVRGMQGLALAVSVTLVAAAQVSFTTPVQQQRGWWLVLAALVVGAIWQYRLTISDWTQSTGRQWGLTAKLWRRIVGAIVVMAGLALWFDGARIFSEHWHKYFDRGWLSWLVAAAILSLGFRVLQTPKTPARNRLARWEWIFLALAFATAAVFRLANYGEFPPDDGASQVEELQAGNFGAHFLSGDRTRWEFLGQAWLGALSLWLGGPTLRSVRMAYSICSVLMVLPAYFWFRALAGTAGAVAGTALFAVSGWATIVNRIPGQHDALIVACTLALLAGPAVRGAWAAYPWVALLGGYTIYTYIAYRPLLLFVLAATVIVGFVRRPAGHWLPRLRDVMPTLLIVGLVILMFIPLTHRLGEGRFKYEYFNGLHRASAIAPYYSPSDSWVASLQKRWDRSVVAANLFYVQGDTNPAHNVEGRPMIDAASGGLLVFGIGYSAVMCLRGFYGLILAALFITFAGTLVATGNFDVLRCAAMIPYLYALVAVGAGGLWAAAGCNLGRIGQMIIAVALIAGVGWSGYWNARLLLDLWSSPVTRRHYRNDLAYLSSWLRENAQGRRAIGLIPSGAGVVFLRNDASWLLGPDVSGESAWDTDRVLQLLAKEHGEVVFLIAVRDGMADLVDYFEYVLPSLKLELRRDDLAGEIRMAHGTIRAPAQVIGSEDMYERYCTGIRARFGLHRADNTVIDTFSSVVPFVDHTTWPGALRETTFRRQREASWIDAAWDGTFEIQDHQEGRYSFLPAGSQGSVTVTIDDTVIAWGRPTPITLQRGTHRIVMQGSFKALVSEPFVRLWWRGPASDGAMQLMPFYRLSSLDSDCDGPMGRRRVGRRG